MRDRMVHGPERSSVSIGAEVSDFLIDPIGGNLPRKIAQQSPAHRPGNKRRNDWEKFPIALPLLSVDGLFPDPRYCIDSPKALPGHIGMAAPRYSSLMDCR